MAGYRWVLSFTHHFTRGALAGLEVPGSMRFVTLADKDRWVEGVTRNVLAGRLDYWVTLGEVTPWMGGG